MKPRTKLARVVAVLLGSFAAALVGAELYLRCFAPVKYRAPLDDALYPEWRTLVHRRSSVPGLLYEPVPHVVRDVRGMHVETNALGMRGPEVEAGDDPKRVRIAAIGDSVTFGFSVAYEEAWPAVLAKLLNERAEHGERYEVLDFGVGGYSTRDEAIVLAAKALPLKPDLAIVAYFLNDPDYEPAQQPLHRWFRGTEWWERSHLLRAIARWRFDRERKLVGDDIYRWNHAEGSDRWRSVLDAFDAMRDAAKRASVPVLVVVFPPYRGFDGWTHYPYADLHARVLAEAERRGFATLDLVPAFVASGTSPWDVSADAEHPNADGHAIAAHAIAELLEARREELLPPR